MTAFYNENDPFAAAWLRELIAAGHIADGVVDERSIVNLRPSDLDGYTQVHFFAGIGGWSYALRLAGWPDDRPVWTGSCPCQPFSAAGKKGGLNDDRHLWPVFAKLLREHRPHVVFGEQVSSADGLEWWDAVSADLEDAEYAAAAIDTCAPSVGAPHRRQRLFWVGYSNSDAAEQHAGVVHGNEGEHEVGAENRDHRTQRDGADSQLGNPSDARRAGDTERPSPRRARDGQRGSSSAQSSVADADSSERGRRTEASERNNGFRPDTLRTEGDGSSPACSVHDRMAGQNNSPWDHAEWVLCNDPSGPRWRQAESGTFPLADGLPSRVGRLRGYGNAIVPQVAAEFIRAFEEAAHELFV